MRSWMPNLHMKSDYRNGSVAERLIAPVSKTDGPNGSVGSNPTASLKQIEDMIRKELLRVAQILDPKFDPDKLGLENGM